MQGVVIERADDKMCGELASLKRKVWETTYKGIYPNEKFAKYDLAKEERKFKGLVDSENIDLFVAIQDEKIIGYMATGKSPHRPFQEEEELVLLYVLKEFQGLGVGRELFCFGKNQIKNRGKKQFFIYCNKYNLPAQKFYLKMGCEILKIDEDDEDKSIPQVKFVYHF